MLTTSRIENKITGEAVLFGHTNKGFVAALRNRDGDLFEFGDFDEAKGLAEQWRLRGDLSPIAINPDFYHTTRRKPGNEE